MSVLFADDFRSYATAADLPYGYGTYVSAPSAVLAASGGRTVLNLLGGTVVKSIPAGTKDVSVYMIADMSSETGSSTTHLLRLGINPPGVSDYTDVTNGYLYLILSETSVSVSRRAYTAAGVLTGSRTTIATGTPPAIASGGIWRIEVRVNETSETCRVTILINGAAVIDQEYTRTIGANACALGLGYFGVTSLNRGVSNFKARIGDLLLSNHDAATPFPLGQLNFDGLDTGVVDQTVSGSQTYDLTNLTALAGAVIATVAVARLESSGVTSRTAKVSLIDVSDVEVASSTTLIVSGVTNTDIRPDGGVMTLAQINALRMKVEIS